MEKTETSTIIEKFVIIYDDVQLQSYQSDGWYIDDEWLSMNRDIAIANKLYLMKKES